MIGLNFIPELPLQIVLNINALFIGFFIAGFNRVSLFRSLGVDQPTVLDFGIFNISIKCKDNTILRIIKPYCCRLNPWLFNFNPHYWALCLILCYSLD